MVTLQTCVAYSWFLLLFVVSQFPGEAIQCYDCNSYNNSSCDGHHLMFTTNCSDKGNPLIQYTMCRKTVLYLDYSWNDTSSSQKRIIRSCAWETDSHSNSCYKKSGSGWRQETCSCSTDLCNGASGLVGTAALSLAAALLFLQ